MRRRLRQQIIRSAYGFTVIATEADGMPLAITTIVLAPVSVPASMSNSVVKKRPGSGSFMTERRL